jgi:hypothetical protein
MRSEEAETCQDCTDQTAAYLGDIVQAVREHRNSDIAGIVMKARRKACR